MTFRLPLVLLAAASLTPAVSAVNVYILSSTDPITDNAASLALTSRGHTVTIGVPFAAFDGTISLANIDTVYLQANLNWASGSMPIAGQQQLINWVRSGGRLVSSEWVTYLSYQNGAFGVLAEILPTVYTAAYGGANSTTFNLVTPNNTIRGSLPSTFSFPLDSYSGTETRTTAKGGASTYFTSTSIETNAGLVGWRVNAGYAYSFTSTCGPNQVADPNFGTLFSNVMSAITAPCENSDFNGDGDSGTDADIEAFFACLAGNCCPTCPQSSDFNGDGDVGTDADIETFFAVLAGGGC